MEKKQLLETNELKIDELLQSIRMDLEHREVEHACKTCRFTIYRKNSLKESILKAKLYKLILRINKKNNKYLGGTIERLTVNLSVDQMAIIIRAYCELGLIVEKNFSKIARGITALLKTSNAERISHKSFRTKMYEVENSDKEEVIRYLQDMIAVIKSL